MIFLKRQKRGFLYIITILFLQILSLFCIGQRTYVANSTLSNGNIVKIGINKQGVYKIDVAFLQQAGLFLNNLATSSIQLLGNGGFMLPENNATFRIDDLNTVSIEMYDGGDGIFNGSDYFLFYADGPDKWIVDTISQNFSFEKNLFENQSYYFIKIGSSSSSKIQNAPLLIANASAVNVGVDKIVLEIDSLNLLKSGKGFFGETMNNASSFTRTFNLQANFNNLPQGQIKLFVSGAARSVNNSCQLEVKINNNNIGHVFFNGVSGGFVSTYANEGFQNFTTTGLQNNILQYSILGGNANTQIWHNKTIAITNSVLKMPASGFALINSWQNYGLNSNTPFTLTNATSNTQIWDVTQKNSPLKLSTNLTGSSLQFIGNTKLFKTYFAFELNATKTPNFIEKISNANLHALPIKPYLIITNASLKDAALRLQNFHINNHQLESNIVNINDIYNEFGSGSKDPTALRDFIKMMYDKSLSSTIKLEYLLLLGDATYKYKDVSNNQIPSWQSNASLDPIATYVSDDFYGYLDDNEDINLNSTIDNIDLAIGRIPARTALEANQFVDKIIAYENPESFGEWRSKCSFVADDEDFNLHLNDAEFLIQNNFNNKPLFNIKKIYLDANTQILNNGSGTYPSVVNQINNAMNNGNVIWNYSGHGTYNRLTEESVIELPTTSNWNTKNKWPIVITATCDFAPFDNPEEFSLGENLLLRKDNGAIALLTTTRLVFANSNKIINNNYLKFQLEKVNNNYNAIGKSIQQAKNATILTGDPVNARKFVCLGDPALKPSFPKYDIKTTSINNIPFNLIADTLKGLKPIKLKGNILNNGILNTNFNGTVKFTIYDKIQIAKTNGNDPTSIVTTFNTNESIIFKGTAVVTNGVFEANFILPKDINLNLGLGSIKYYAFNNVDDAWGVDSIIVGGLNSAIITDNAPPEIILHINNNKTTNNCKVTNSITLIANLKDASGINLSTAGIGHEITAQIDNNPEKIILNDNFIQTSNIYPEGNISYFIGDLALGKHKITLKAWDVYNNSATQTIYFEVIEPLKTEIFELRNYPNPFVDKTTIIAGHNLTSPTINAELTILNSIGQILFSKKKEIENNAQHICVYQFAIPNALEAFKGQLYYRLTLKNASGNSEYVTKSGKMIKF